MESLAVGAREVNELAERLELVAPEEGKLDWEFLREAFGVVKQDFYRKGASERESSKYAWLTVTSFVINRVTPKLDGYLFEAQDGVRSEVEVMRHWMDKFMKNFLEGKLGEASPF